MTTNTASATLANVRRGTLVKMTSHHGITSYATLVHVGADYVILDRAGASFLVYDREGAAIIPFATDENDWTAARTLA